MYTTKVVDSVAQINSLESAWKELLAQSRHPTVFNTFAWASCWLQIYWQADYALRIILVETGGKLVALLPLYIQNSTSTCWFVGSGEPEAEEVASEYQDFIVHRDHADSAELASCISAQLAALQRYRLEFWCCTANSYVATLLRSHRRARLFVSGAVYKLPIQDSFAATSRAFSKNQLKNARQYLNRFNAAPELEYVGFHNDGFPSDWQTLRTLHQQDWTARGKNGAFHSERFSRFHALMHSTQPHIRQAFVALKHNGDTLAIHHFYVYGQHYCFYVGGTEKHRENRLSPGLMLHVLAMQELSRQGATYDFMRGSTGDNYKAKFCPRGELFYDITVFENSLHGTCRLWLTRLKQFVRTLRKPGVNNKQE
jgi:CelD/BcsL family acetyltransferase involved in cellulose biosynthesis